MPYSEGSRVAELDSLEVILNDEPSLISWSYNFNVDVHGNLWMTDMKQHSIFYISKEEADWNAWWKVSGTEGTIGSRDGNIKKATFNEPSSLAPYYRNETNIKLMSKL